MRPTESAARAAIAAWAWAFCLAAGAAGPAPDPRSSHQAWAVPLLWLGGLAVACGIGLALRRRQLARQGIARVSVLPWPRLLVALGLAPFAAWPVAQFAFADAFDRFAGKGTLAPEFIAGPIWFSAFVAAFALAFLLGFLLLGALGRLAGGHGR
ncbi:hypothetical protein [Derxia gummosa]|uniref:Uncharacterized protein n=1 Tax=Derxia gummosa DSM 723 TaxID=1121388 RepID=A0A8B6X378_9BURK|nr:hypothetical protein [Derxia gummosa]